MYVEKVIFEWLTNQRYDLPEQMLFICGIQSAWVYMCQEKGFLGHCINRSGDYIKIVYMRFCY